MSGSHKGSSSSISQQNRLEDLFLIEEDAKDNEEDNVESETPIIKDDVTQFPITAEIFVPPDGGYGWLIGKRIISSKFYL